MIRNSLFTLLALVSFQTLNAAECWFGAGFRQDTFNWNIAGPGHQPTVLSELEWEDIRMCEVSAGIGGEMYDTMYYRFTGDYAKTYSGNVTDSDYYLDNRQGMFSESVSKANQGFAYDLSVGIGYPLHYFCNDLLLIPLIGYKYSVQKFTIRDGFQTFSLEPGGLGPIYGLNSHFKTEWNSIWIGCDGAYQFCPAWRVFGTFEFHVVDYHGSGHWNLRRDFLEDFQHNGWGGGPLGVLGIEYYLNKCLSSALSLEYSYMQVKDGTDHTKFMDDDGAKVEGELALNQVNWHCFKINLFVNYDF